MGRENRENLDLTKISRYTVARQYQPSDWKVNNRVKFDFVEEYHSESAGNLSLSTKCRGAYTRDETFSLAIMPSLPVPSPHN